MGRYPKQERAIDSEEVRLGRVNGVFGVRGEVRLFLHNRETELFEGGGFNVTLVSPEGERQSRRLTSRSGAGKRVLGKIDGVESPEAARSFIDWEIVCSPDALPDPGQDEYYHRDLIGLQVQTPDGANVGVLSDVLVGDVIDCWQIQAGDEEVIVPAIKQVVVSVDVKAGIVIINDPVDLEA